MKVIAFNPITGNRFFSGSSDQEKASQDLYGQAKALNPNVRNRWDSYTDPFSYNDVSKNVEDAFTKAGDTVERTYNDAITTGKADAASSLASRGVTGGSAVTDTEAGVASKINQSKASVLGDLGAKKSSSMADLMKFFDNMGLMKTQGAQGVDLVFS